MRISVTAVAIALLFVAPMLAPAMGQAALPIAPSALAQGEGETAGVVTGFQFTGNEVLSEDALQAAVAPFEGKPVEQLEDIKAAVVELYFGRGYHASVEASEDAGIVAVRITEGKVGEVTVSESEYHSNGFVREHFGGLTPGSVWRQDSLERAMLLLRELPGLGNASATLRKGADPAATDVEVSLNEYRPDQPLIVLAFDNFGSPNSSKARFTERIGYEGFTGRGDSAVLQLVHGTDFDDLLFGQLNWEIPINAKGTRVGAHVGAGDFEVGRNLSVLDLSGNRLTYGVSAKHPLQLTRNRSLIAEAGLDIDDADFEMGLGRGCPTPTQTLSEDRVRKLRLGVALEDTEPGEAYNVGSLFLHQGLGSFLGGTESNQRNPNPSRVGADNSFTKLSVQGARLQRLSDRAQLMIRLSGQASTGALLVGEQMAIGGADSVRGYPQSEFLGDNGVQAGVELRYDPGLADDVSWLQQLQAVLFIDHGSVHRDSPAPGEDEWSHITGAGTGLRAVLDHGFSIRADVGFALGGPEPSTGGRAQPYVKVQKAF